MSDWIPVCEFSLDQDLSEVAQFIQRHHLPLRIAEENNRQLVSTLDPRLRQPVRELLERWRAGEVQLAQVSVQTQAQPPEQTAGKTSATEEGRIPIATDLHRWPWQKTPLCLLLIALCFIGWLLQSRGLVQGLMILAEPGGDFDLSRSTLARHLANGEYWRLWTPAIVHFSLPHALFNALGIWILGRPLEARAGSLVFLFLVLVSAPVANLSQYLWMPQSGFGGMSGVVYALVGVVFVLQRWQPGWSDVPAGLVGLAIVWLLLCAFGVVGYVFGIRIANAAHLGGFVCGLLLAFTYCVAGGARNFSTGDGAGEEKTN